MGQREGKYKINGVKDESPVRSFPLALFVYMLALAFCAVLPFTSLGKKLLTSLGTALGGEERIVERVREVPVEKVVQVPVEVQIPVVTKAAPAEKVSVNQNHQPPAVTENITNLSNSSRIQLQTKVEFKESKRLASVEREDLSSYQIDYAVSARLPQPARSLIELQSVHPQLSSILPGIEVLLEDAKVSPYFYEIYKRKAERIKRDATKLRSLLTRHNFFDLQTILNLESKAGRKVMLMQADMDVVSDGSDGDRLPVMPEKIVNSTFYQPSTSYFWKKQTKTPNPMIAGFEARVKNATAELADAQTTAARKAWLKERLKMLNTKIQDMKYHSYLVAEYDPFIVMPVSMLTDMQDEFAPKVGDYAIVLYKDRVYPCIVGDGGPKFKVGEGSLRMAKELNKRAGIYSRPVSDLSVTYIVFPNSREKKKSAPDYEKWREKCQELLGQIGGMSPDYQLFNWKNTFPEIN